MVMRFRRRGGTTDVRAKDIDFILYSSGEGLLGFYLPGKFHNSGNLDLREIRKEKATDEEDHEDHRNVGNR